MPTIYVIYRRKDAPIVQRMATELTERLEVEVFVDFASIDSADFESAILDHLRRSNAVLLIVTKHTFSDRINRSGDWVRREIREALNNDLPILPVFFDDTTFPSEIPDDINSILDKPGTSVLHEFFEASMSKLADLITKAGIAQQKSAKDSRQVQNEENLIKQKVFISYSRNDKSFVLNITGKLAEMGIDYWVDLEGISVGSKWSSSIQQALDECDVMILVVSPSSMNSKNVEDEWNYYQDEDKSIIPLLIDPKTKIHFQLRRIQYVDFCDASNFDDAFQKLVIELQQHKLQDN